MATVIDALLVTLGLDASNFSKGAKQAEDAQKKISDTSKKAEKERADIDRKTKAARDQQAKEVEEKTKQAAQGLNKLKNEALGFLAIFATASGLKAFAQDTIQTATNLGFMAANLGMSTKDLDAWQAAAERAGGSAEGMTAQLKDSASEIAQYHAGMGPSEGMQWFLRLGGDPAAFKDGNTYLLARADVLKKVAAASGPAAATLAAANMRVNESALNPLKQGSAAFLELVEAQKKHSVITEEDSAQALALQNSIKDLNREFQAMGRRLLLDIVPVITQRVMPAMREFSGWVTAHKPEIGGFIDGLTKGVSAFGEIAVPVLKMVAGGWEKIFNWVVAIGEKTASLLPSDWVDGMINGAGSLWAGAKGMIPKSWKDYAKDNVGGYFEKSTPTPTAGGAGSAKLFADLEAQNGLQPGLLDSMWKQESNRGRRMTSPAGAQGHFQFIPGTAKQYGLKDPNDLTESAGAAARMMKDLLKANGGDLTRALSAYNWGQGNLNKYGLDRAPAETRNYPIGILSRMGAGSAQRGGGSTSSTDVRINQITVNTRATDAAGIAGSLAPALTNYDFATQANGGF